MKRPLKQEEIEIPLHLLDSKKFWEIIKGNIGLCYEKTAHWHSDMRNAKLQHESRLLNSLRDKDHNGFISGLKSMFSSIPYHNYANNIIAHYEGNYCSVVFVYLSALGYQVLAEDTTNKGRIDLTLIMDDQVVIIEFKVDSKEPAIKQIKEKKYFEKYMQQKKRIYLVGINFDSIEKNVKEYDIERFA